MHEDILALIEKNERIKDFYSVGPVQRAAIESFVEGIIDLIQKQNIHTESIPDAT